MGSVTYRVLCLTSTLVLALPPGIAAARSRESVALDADAQVSLGIRGAS